MSPTATNATASAATHTATTQSGHSPKRLALLALPALLAMCMASTPAWAQSTPNDDDTPSGESDSPDSESPDSESPDSGEPDAKTKTQAKDLFEKGEAFFRLGEQDPANYDKAIVEFESAYKLFPSPVFILNIAQAHRLRNNKTQARQEYQRFLREAPNHPNAGEVRKLLPELDREIEAEKTARADRRIDAVGSGKRLAGLLTMAVGLAAGGVGIFYWNRSRTLNNEIEGVDDAWTDPLIDKNNNKGPLANKLAYGFGLGGVAVLAGGATLYFLGRRDRSNAERQLRSEFKVIPTATGDSASLTLLGRF